MSRKFIPNGDSEFANMARAFAGVIQHDPAVFAVGESECAWLVQQVAEFRDALAVAKHPRTRTPSAVMQKDQARAQPSSFSLRECNCRLCRARRLCGESGLGPLPAF